MLSLVHSQPDYHIPIQIIVVNDYKQITLHVHVCQSLENDVSDNMTRISHICETSLFMVGLI